MGEILYNLLLLDGNETTVLSCNTYMDYKCLLVEATKAEKNIRYCDTKGCSCHPESMIKVLLKNKELVDFLKEHINYEELIRLTNDYEPITIFERKWG